MFMKIDRDSNVKWIQTGRFHHDFCVAENGDIYAISRHSEYLTYPDLTGFILNDYITVLSSDGTVKGNISLFDFVKEEISPERLAEINHSINSRKNLRTIEERMGSEQLLIDNGTDHDILHTNTVEEVTRDIEGVCRKGDLLISIREMDLIGILNLAQKKLVWQWGPGVLDEQHHPSLLENGNILVFDNGRERDYSRLLELDPRTKEIVWEYKADPSNAFFTVSGGSCQRLPNGNTLICESARGHAFEVTPDGDIVWEFFNPSIKKGKKRRASLYRFMRIVDPENYPFLETLSQS
jgi:hypothetical protein